MAVSRGVHLRRRTLISALIAGTVLLCTTTSLEASHLAHAADSRGEATAPAATTPTFEDLAGQRSARLRSDAADINAVQQSIRLAAHQRREKKAADSITAEVARLRNLSRFAWPTEGGVASGFGMRKHPILGYTRLHNGADIGGACGNPIRAAQSGTVTKAGYSSSSGNNIRIDHGSIEGRRVETAYLHMSRLAARSGQTVAKGDVIGYVGTTGLSTACHLHLALYEDGRGSDPLQYLRQD